MNKRDKQIFKSIPGPKEFPVLGSSLQLAKDPLHFLLNCLDEFDGPFRITVGPSKAIFFDGPNYVEHILLKQHANFSKLTTSFLRLKLFLGDGLLTIEGDQWKKIRGTISPCFHQQYIQNLTEKINSVVNQSLNNWKPEGKINITNSISELTLKILINSILNTTIEIDYEKIKCALKTIHSELFTKIMSPLFIPLLIPTPTNLKLKKGLKIFDETIDRIIQDRINNSIPSEKPDIIDLMMENGIDSLKDQILMFFVAGHETTANMLIWTWYLLSKHPNVSKKLLAEIKGVLTSDNITFSDIKNLKYTKAVLLESLRLYPPVWTIPRRTIKNTIIDGFEIPKGTSAILSTYITHRNPKYWDNPADFNPDRFLEPNLQKISKFSYFPFGHGPRQCLGKEFALLEGTIILAQMARRFEFSMINTKITLDPKLTLRPKEDIIAVVHPYNG
ncbi:MAG: cytochrome P450 [Candidatus Margulisbacteria bacterium]|nr:cytochrome P450 [Candidatus Margulisiibacteriota bacterium]